MKYKYPIFLLLFFSITSFGMDINICNHLAGKWTGNWVSETQVEKTDLYFVVNGLDEFSGFYLFENNQKGFLHGHCSLHNKEVFFKLDPDPPLYNPCYGHIRSKSNQLFIICIHPNQGGFFQKE